MDTPPPVAGSALGPLVAKLEYRSKLSAEDRAAILGLPHFVKVMEQNHYVVREFDRPSHCSVMLSGFAVRHKIVTGGSRQIVSIQMKGELVDLQNSLLGIADHSVQMLTPGKIAFIPRDAMTHLIAERPTVARALWIDSLVDASIFREWIANVGRRDARTRIAHLFCEFSLRLKIAGLGDQTDYEMPMTQEQLADATGLTAVHVNRTIKGLEADGLIARIHPRSITIGDWRKLADTGDFNSAYLHLRDREPALH